MSALVRAWYGEPGRPRLAEVTLPAPERLSMTRRLAQEALARVIAAQGITGVPLDVRGLPHLTGIEAAP